MESDEDRTYRLLKRHGLPAIEVNEFLNTLSSVTSVTNVLSTSRKVESLTTFLDSRGYTLDEYFLLLKSKKFKSNREILVIIRIDSLVKNNRET